MATKQQQQQQAGDRELDPEYEWQESAANFVLRLHLSGFRKEDFRVQVDGAGRLTVRGQRTDAGGKSIRFHKVFQLPPASILDDISGRFDAGVLSITVPKRPAPPPADDIIRKQAKPKEEEEKADKTQTTTPQVQGKDENKKAEQINMEEDATKKAAAQKIKEEMEARMKATAHKIKDEVEAKKPAADKIKEEVEAKKKAAAEKIREEVEAKRSKPADQEQQKEEEANNKPKVEGPTETKPSSQQAADKVVDRESLLERARRRAEEDRAKAAAAEEAERHKAKPSACGGWKERVAEELQGLKGSEWAEGVLETVKKNKEVIAAAVTAFSLGLFVARLASRN